MLNRSKFITRNDNLLSLHTSDCLTKFGNLLGEIMMFDSDDLSMTET